MKKCTHLITYVLIMFAFGAHAQISLSALGAVTAPDDVLRYSSGFGFRVGLYIEHVYFGTAWVFHRGSKTSTHYEAFFNYYPERTIIFDSDPILIAHDIGYEIIIPVGGKKTVLLPHFSLGLMAFAIKSSHLNGTRSHLEAATRRGLGIMYQVPVAANLSAGLHYRWYPFRDKDFEFGTSDASVFSYGFSSPIRYSAIGLELVYRFPSLFKQDGE